MMSLNKNPISGKTIWSDARPNNGSHLPNAEKIRLEFTSLIHFKGYWYCGFREAQIHNNHPSGQARIIRSADGEKWETAKIFSWDGADVREPKLSITSEGDLVVFTSIYFVPKEPRTDGNFYILDKNPPTLDATQLHEEKNIFQQMVSWITTDGQNWSSAYTDPLATNIWLWDLVWHNGMGYSVGYSVASRSDQYQGVLCRTRDAKSWRVLHENAWGLPSGENYCPQGQSSETALAFGKDHTLHALLRGSGSTIAKFGIGKPPYYQQWTWKNITVDWYGDGNPKPIETLFRVELGGPKLICLSDGRLLGAGRTLPPRRADGPWRIDSEDPNRGEDGRIVLFWIDPQTAIATRFAEMDGTSYVSIVEYQGELWITYSAGDRSGIALAKVKIPPL